jgi:hypothetical protein
MMAGKLRKRTQGTVVSKKPLLPPYSDHLVRSMGRAYVAANDSELRLAFRELNQPEISLAVEMGILNCVWNALDESLKSGVRHIITESTSVVPLLTRVQRNVSR